MVHATPSALYAHVADRYYSNYISLKMNSLIYYIIANVKQESMNFNLIKNVIDDGNANRK